MPDPYAALTGGAVALLVIKEVFAFVKTKKNGQSIDAILQRHDNHLEKLLTHEENEGALLREIRDIVRDAARRYEIERDIQSRKGIR